MRRFADVLVITVGDPRSRSLFRIRSQRGAGGTRNRRDRRRARRPEDAGEHHRGLVPHFRQGGPRVGDTLKFGNTVGTVDYIGLRSTRIRTLDRTILTVPNGQIASVGIETLSNRDKFWFHHIVGLRYETTAAQLRLVIDGVQKLLAAHKQVDARSVRVRFIRLGAFSLDIEVSAYVFTRDGDGFLDVQQELLLRIMEGVDAAGTVIAIPSQTLHIADRRLPDNPAADQRAEPEPLRTAN